MRILALVQPAGKDIFFQLFLRKQKHGFGRVVLFEEFRGDFVHALVGALRGENDRDQKFVRGGVVQSGTRIFIQFDNIRSDCCASFAFMEIFYHKKGAGRNQFAPRVKILYPFKGYTKFLPYLNSKA